MNVYRLAPPVAPEDEHARLLLEIRIRSRRSPPPILPPEARTDARGKLPYLPPPPIDAGPRHGPAYVLE